MKGRTFPQFRLHPDASSVPFHNLFAYRETDARAGIVSPSVKALEYDEIVLNLRQLSGDLGNSYVDQNSWQK